MRGKSSAAGPPTPRATPARAIAAVARPNASLEKAAPRVARRALRASRADRSFAHTSLPTTCGRPTRTRSAHASLHEKRGPVGKWSRPGGTPVAREGAERERKGHGEKARHHEAELEKIRPHDGSLAAERRVRDEKGRRDDEDAHGIPRRRRDDDGFGRLGQEREPDDLREDDEKGGDPAHAFSVRPSHDLGNRRRTRRAHAWREKEAEDEEAERSCEVEPESRQAHAGDERRENEGRGPADDRGGEGRPGRERRESAVGHEERVHGARGVSCRKEADEENGGAIEDEGGGHASALRGLSRRGRRARSPRGGALRAAGRARRSRSRGRGADPAGRRTGPRRRTRTRPGRAAGTR